MASITLGDVVVVRQMIEPRGRSVKRRVQRDPRVRTGMTSRLGDGIAENSCVIGAASRTSTVWRSPASSRRQVYVSHYVRFLERYRFEST